MHAGYKMVRYEVQNYLISARANWQARDLIGSFHIPERSSHPAPTSVPNVTRRTSVNQDSWDISRSCQRNHPQHALTLETGFTGIDVSLAFVNCLNLGALE